ncbi:ABC transporter permease [Serinibacter arcticus]|uniref:ABC transporter permease n=1 Tax=Serinibacter arcticus TaxID=1655435 RepID=A0A2U1ZXZ9_9MICO|nr:ABC transporter permease [Serinibacter arcticus]PWD51859.1 ABC transporter permease [Serinibacter arcticus]
MTTTQPTPTRPTAPRASAEPSTGTRATLRRVRALARAEITLLLRNRVTLFNGVALAPLMVGLIAGVGGDRLLDLYVPGGAASAVMIMVIAFALTFVVYYNLTTVLVARREELVLKRLLVGECSRTEILVATVVPAAVVMGLQVILSVVVALVTIGTPTFANPVLIVVGVVGGLVVLAQLAVATSGITRTVESAQLTTLPGLVLLGIGAFIPVTVLPDWAVRVLELTPLNPVASLLRLGIGGVDAEGAPLDLAQTFEQGLRPLVVLVAWVLIGSLLARRSMRWEPRR